MPKSDSRALVGSFLLLLTLGLTALGEEKPPSLCVHPRCAVLSWPASEVTKDGGRFLTVTPEGLRESLNEGAAWQDVSAIVQGTPPEKIAQRYAFPLQTRNGSLVVIYIDPSTAEWAWDRKSGTATAARRNVWSIRSLDGGKTWIDRTMVYEGYCGYLSGGSLMELPSGRLVVPVQHWISSENRHAQLVFASDDDGKSWKSGNTIDVGGRGHHDGAMESTMVRLKDGRLWLLIRTNLDAFWQAFSSDEGTTWTKPEPTSIDASSSPGALKRLSDGSLLLVWNRLYPEGQPSVRRQPKDGNYASSNAASSQREELAGSFSFDEGKTWSPPEILAWMPKGRVCYPRIFEKGPGVVLITAVVGPPNRHVTFRLNPSDFHGNSQRPVR